MGRCLGLLGVAWCLCVSPTVAQDKGVLTGKAWTVMKSEHAPPGTTMVFTADGKLTISMKIDGKIQEMPGTYTHKGTQLILKFTSKGRDITDSRVIKKLTDSDLVTEDRNQKVEELQR